MDLGSSVVRGLKWTAGAKLLTQAMTWGITLLVMRLLTPDDYGLMAMATFFISFTATVAGLGLGNALVQAQEIDDAAVRQVFGTVLLFNFLLFALMFLAADPIARFFDEPRLNWVVRVLSSEFLLAPFAVIPDAMLQRSMHLKQRAMIDFVAAIGTSLLTLALAFAGAGVWSLVAGILSAVVIRVIGVNIVRPYLRVPAFALRRNRALLGFGGNVTLARLLFFLHAQADVVIVGKVLGKEALGLYSVAIHIASLPVQRLSAITNQLGFSAFSRIQDQPDKVREYFLLAVRTVSLVVFPVLWGIGCVAPELVRGLLGTKWEGAIFPMQVIAAVMPLRMIGLLTTPATDGVGRSDMGVKNLALLSIVMPLALIAGSRWGLYGVCIAWVVAYPPVFLYNLARSLDVLGLRARQALEAMARPVLSGAVMWVLVELARPMLPDGYGSIARLAILVAAGALVYAALTLMLNRRGLQEMMQLVFRR